MEARKPIKQRPNKYILKYGKSLNDIAKIFGVSQATIHNWNKEPKKKEWMENMLKDLDYVKRRCKNEYHKSLL